MLIYMIKISRPIKIQSEGFYSKLSGVGMDVGLIHAALTKAGLEPEKFLEQLKNKMGKE